MELDVELELGDEADEENCVYESTGNVFADIGRPDAAELHARSQLMIRITDILRELKLTQAQMALLLGTSRRLVSQLMRGRLHEFSIEKLFDFLDALECDAEITIHRRKPIRRISLRRASQAH